MGMKLGGVRFMGCDDGDDDDDDDGDETCICGRFLQRSLIHIRHARDLSEQTGHRLPLGRL